MTKSFFSTKRFFTLLSIMALVSIATVSLTNSGGAAGGNTNAPSEANCTTCHSGSLQTSGTNYNNISFSGNFTGGGYIPDSTYTITLSYSHSGKTKFGYQLTCLDNSDAMAGSFSLISGNNKSGMTTASIGGATRSYMRHTSSGNSGTGSISWSFKWTAPSTNKGTLTIYSVLNSTNKNSATSGDIIIAKEFSIAPSSLLPVATASASNTNPCQGRPVSLSGVGTNSPTSWAWSISGASPSVSTAQNPTVLFVGSGTFRAILTVKNSKGFSKPDTVTLVVKAGPSAFIGGGATQTICEGDSVRLLTNFSSGVSYTWNSGQTGNFIWAKDTGEYFVTAVKSNGCGKVSNTVNVKYYTKPVATLSSNASVFNDSSCIGSPIILEASSAAFDSFYYYADGSLLTVSDSSKLMTAFDSTTTYSLKVKNSIGCLSDLSDYTVTAREKIDAPAIVCTATTPSSIQFSWSSAAAHNGYEVSINNGTSWTSPSSGGTGSIHLVTGLQPDDSVTLWVRAIDDAPCYVGKVGMKTCFTESCTQLDVSIDAISAICKGDLWTVEVNGLANKNYSLSLDGGAHFLDTIFSFNPTSSTTYVLSVVDSMNLVCPAKEVSIPLVVDRINDIQLKSDKIGAYCEGEKATFSANDSIDNFNFFWNGTLVQSGSSNTYENSSMNNGDSVYVVVSKGVCIDTSINNYISIELPADASFTYTRERAIYTFTPTDLTYSKYSWNFGDGSAVDNAIEPTHDYASLEGSTVIAKLEIETSNSCDYDSTMSIDLPLFSNVADLKLLGLSIYPNPVEDVLNVSNVSGKVVALRLMDLSGAVLYQGEANKVMSSVDVSKLKSGVYLLEVSVDGKTSIQRILKN